ncbi:hypothetical protein VTK26DRAFT_4900 [Humicola hyalothermophila]
MGGGPGLHLAIHMARRLREHRQGQSAVKTGTRVVLNCEGLLRLDMQASNRANAKPEVKKTVPGMGSDSVTCTSEPGDGSHHRGARVGHDRDGWTCFVESDRQGRGSLLEELGKRSEALGFFFSLSRLVVNQSRFYLHPLYHPDWCLSIRTHPIYPPGAPRLTISARFFSLPNLRSNSIRRWSRGRSTLSLPL